MFRDNHGLELDLPFREGAGLVGIEAKSGATLHARSREASSKFDSALVPLARKPIVYDGAARTWSDGTKAIGRRAVGEHARRSSVRPRRSALKVRVQP